MAFDTVRAILRHPSRLFRHFRVLGEGRLAAKRVLERISKAVWRIPLDRERTFRMLDGNQVHVAQDEAVLFKPAEPIAGDRPPTFRPYEIPFEPECVWRLERGEEIRSMRIASSGTILLNDKLLLDTDFGSLPGIADRPVKRRRVRVETAIVPWSHKWATYYEFVMHVLSKLCRIKEAMGPSSWATSKVCYPLLNTPYERQYLSLLGVRQDAILDTRKNIDVAARSIITSNLQRSSRLPSPTGILALRRAFLGQPQEVRNGERGLYFSREGWARRVRNDAEVRRLVSSYGLEVVESVPVSVSEQIQMFREASLIVSPHGSVLTNLVWCAPGTRVIELFSRSFTPPMYAYMSQVMGLRHAYLVDDAGKPHHWTNMHEHMEVDICSLARAIEEA